MILKKLKLKNFRGYKDFEVEFDDTINVIIGRNDIGKSTILEALEIFFNSEKIKMDISALCVYSEDATTIEITCCFDVGDASVLIDSTCATNCRDEYLLNGEGFLEIKKTWNCASGSVTKNGQKDYLVANYPVIYDPPLVTEKIQTLRRKYDELCDNPDCPQVNRSVASELRRAIYAVELKHSSEFRKTDIEMSKEDAKNIRDSLYKQFPNYYIFESDRKNTDRDNEIQDPLKAVTKTVLSEMSVEIERMQQLVRERVEEIGRRTIAKLAELNSDIAENIHPVVTVKPLDSAFNFELQSDNGIPLNKRGSGVRRLILLSYFRAEAERSIVTNPNSRLIYAIEEPETSQHPDFQRMIFDTLNNISQMPTHQIIVTSHTPEIAKLVTPEQLILLRRDENQSVIAVTEMQEKIRSVSKELGILPYASTKTVVFVEGPNDVNFLMNLNQNIPELKSIIDLKEEEIPVIPLHGGTLLEWINRDSFAGTNLRQIYIVDNDVQGYKAQINEINGANDGVRYGWVTRRYEMENYIPRVEVEKEFDILLEQYDDWYERDIPQLLKGVCMLDIKDANEREKKIKQRINGRITKKLNKADLERIDAWEEIEMWFQKIRSIANGTYVKSVSER